MTNGDNYREIAGVSFNDGILLKQAFVHSSYLNENPDFAPSSNERLEFLGDAVLDFVAAERLYREFPELSEGELTAIRATLVCRQTLAKAAFSLKLGDLLLLGRGEEISGGRKKETNLANSIEALIGAIYLDQGLAKAKEFVIRQLEPNLKKIKQGEISPNYKALLQEFTQSENHSSPTYHLMKATGPDHEKQFTVSVLVEGKVLGQGTGKNKKAAEIEAARSAWRKLHMKEDLPTSTPCLGRGK
jgi:ribonuclease-3